MIGLTANATPWDIVPVITDGANPNSVRPQSPQLSMQRGGSSDQLQTIESLSLTQYAKNLGKISALAASEDGTLYAADYKTGRVWILSDRGQDGSLDMRRPMAQTFNNPTGLAIIGETLYVADRQAIWAIEPGSQARMLAPLSNIKSQGSFALIAEDEGLILGITQSASTQNGAAIIVSIDITTGQAEKIANIQNVAPLHSIAKRKGAPLWVASGQSMQSLDSPETRLTFSQQNITAIALPGQYTTPANWPRDLKESIIASQTGPNSMQLIVIPTEFGQPSQAPRVLVEGFLSGSGRSAWGQPGAIVMDKRGLFFADTHNGTLWHLSVKPKIEPPKVVVDTPKKIEKTVETKSKKSPLLVGSGIKGSQIGEASQIGAASQLKTGSTLIDAYEKEQAEAEALKAAEEDAKKPSKKSRSKRSNK